MDSIEAIIVRADLTGNLSEASQAATRDLVALEAATAKVRQGAAGAGEAAERTSQSFGRLEAALDGNVRVTNAKSVADARLARETALINANVEAGAAGQARANALIEEATRRRDAYIAKVRQDVAASEARTASLLGEAAAMQRLGVANDNAGAATGRFGGIMGQAGYQVQDFVTQVQMGQNALMAFGVQGAQLLGAFGTGGAIAGAVLVFGTLAAQMLGIGSATDELTAAIDAQQLAMKQANEQAERYTSRIEDQAEAMVRLGASYRTTSEAVRTFDAARVNQAQGNLTTQRGEIDNRLFGSLDSSIAARQGVTGATDPMGGLTGFLTSGGRALAPGMEQLRQALAEFRAESVITSDAIATLYNRLMSLDTGTASTNSAVRQAAAGLMAAAPDMLRVADAQREAAVQFLAIREAAGASGAELDRYAARFGNLAVQVRAAAAQMNALRQGAIGGAEDRIANEITRNEAVLQAFRANGREAAQALQDAGTRQEQIMRRATELEEARVRQMVAAGSTANEARAAVRELQTEFVTLATRAVDSGKAASDALTPPRDGARATAAAVRDVAEAYAELRTRGGAGSLLLGSDADAKAQDTITAYFRNAEQARSRQEAETARTAEREETARQNEANRFTQNWGDRLALETTRGLFEGTKNGETFFQRIGNSLKNILISAASSALSANVFQPLIASATGGNVSSGGMSLGGLFGGSTARPGQPAGGGGVTDTGSSLGTLRRAYDGFTSPGGLGSYFPGGAPVNTGFGSVNSALNTSLIAPSATTEGLSFAANANGFYPGTAMVGEAGAFAGGGGAASSGLTYAQVLGPAAAVAGGAYGVYSGIQRGGVGGYTSAAGGAVSAVTGLGMLGAAAGLLPALGVLGPIGLAIGAVLAIAGALMPGAKPSGMGQLARTNLNSGLETTEGLGGKRFSAGNATAAGSTVDNIVTLAKEIGAKLGGASIGGDVAVGVTNGNIYLDINGQKTNAANSEQGAKDIAAAAATMVLNEFRGQGTVGGEYQGIVAGSGSLDALNANLEWYEKTYQVVTEATPKVSAFEQSLKALSDQFQPNIEKARELSLSVEAMTVARDRELQKLTVARDAQLRSFEQGLEVRGQRLMGNNEWADTLAFNLQAETFLADTRKSLEDLGLSAETVADRMSRAEAVLAGERLLIQRQYADQALAVQAQTLAAQQQAEQQALAARQAGAGGALGVVTSLRDYAASLTTGEAGGGTALDRLAASQRQFDAIFGAAAAGDANSISGLRDAAETFRINSREVFGGGQQFADAVSLIGRRIDAIGELGADALTQSFMIENARANTDRVVDQLAALRADINMLMMRPVAA